MSGDLLKAVSEWQREASREDATLFFPVPELELLLEGRRLIVIGRKGTGKTAIAEQIMSLADHDIFCEKLSFKNFPFHLLYDLKDTSFTPKSEYISLWKYVILNSLGKLVSSNEGISTDAHATLRKKFPVDGETRLNRILSNWISKSFGVTILGTGVTGSTTKNTNIDSNAWRSELEILETLLLGTIDSNKYFILFDALDDDYEDMQKPEAAFRYLDLLIGLIKAACEIHEAFKRKGAIVLPVVFLRSDIYRLLHGADVNKWPDLLVNLVWRRDLLQNMMAHRISKTADPHRHARSFVPAWRSLFTPERLDVGDRVVEAFDYIGFRTNTRPRDFIVYVKHCAKVASEKGFELIDAQTVINSEKDYSDYLRSEIAEELHPIVPDIDLYFKALSRINKTIFRADEFYKVVENMYDRREIDSSKSMFTPSEILGFLYKFDVVGNKNSSGHSVFDHSSPDTGIDYDARFVLHAGLLRNLGIVRKPIPTMLVAGPKYSDRSI
ncbi:MAG TPA: hypothetical protein VJ750_03635 [Rhizomicrobium sp.]|nr:hypothetical protein [Rhizomicrobium sp.]